LDQLLFISCFGFRRQCAEFFFSKGKEIARLFFSKGGNLNLSKVRSFHPGFSFFQSGITTEKTFADPAMFSFEQNFYFQVEAGIVQMTEVIQLKQGNVRVTLIASKQVSCF
jgi:hypothetical protein